MCSWASVAQLDSNQQTFHGFQEEGACWLDMSKNAKSCHNTCGTGVLRASCIGTIWDRLSSCVTGLLSLAQAESEASVAECVFVPPVLGRAAFLVLVVAMCRVALVFDVVQESACATAVLSCKIDTAVRKVARYVSRSTSSWAQVR